MRIIAYIFRRVALAVGVLTLVALIVFIGTEVLPGDAVTASIPAEELIYYSPKQLDALRAEYGLDRPIPVRFFDVWKQLFTFDFGVTLVKREPVFDRIIYPMRNSAIMAGTALVVMLVLVLIIGIAAAWKPGGRIDSLLSGGILAGYSLPEFVVGNLFVIVFAVWLGIAPAVIMIGTKAPALDMLAVTFLPVAALCVASAAYQFRLLRAGMIEALEADYIERAQLAGVPRWRLLITHALPSAMIPMLNGTASFVAGVLSGTVVLEAVFKYPGAGVELLRALSQRDIPSIQAIAFLAALTVVLCNLLADLAALALDPRIRRGGRNG